MRIAVEIALLVGAYDAGDPTDPMLAEWPPHPARLFCALVAAARGEADRAVLAWLERQPAPAVHAATAGVARREAYVVTNSVVAEAGSQTHPGRTNGLRTRARALPVQPRVRFVWDAHDPPEGVVAALDRIARRVPYLGRSTGVALVAATGYVESQEEVERDDAASADEADLQVFEPCDLADAEMTLRLPYPGYLAELDALHETGRSAWGASRFYGYRRRSAAPDTPEPVAAPSPYVDLIAFQFAGLKPDGRLAARFTEALRSRVLGCAGDTAPTVLHGHGADGRPHVAFLALPDIGHDHADGHLLGLAVAVPDLPAGERRAALDAVLGLRDRLTGRLGLRMPNIGEVDLSYEPGLVRPWGASPDRWRRGSERWASATPVVLDRYPKNREQETDIVLGSLRMLGLPDPVAIRVSSEPLTEGAVRMRPTDLPRQVQGRLYRHVTVRFPHRVHGPLMLGAGRYLGLGLMAPHHLGEGGRP